ncbi:MAG: M48 family metallopeptidase [Acidobacteriota bacterium]|nr:M48 family metallopeptidase [Acidobacteriota bacterium]
MQLGSKVLAVVTLLAALVLSTASSCGMTPTEAKAAQHAVGNASAYTLPPGKLLKAMALSRIGRVLTVGGAIWTLVQLTLLLALGVVARIRDFAIRLSKNTWTQGFAFLFCFLLVTFLLDLPLAVYGHSVSLNYGLSVQRWGSWLGDKAKVFGLEWGIGGVTMMLFVWFRHKSPTRWWFWFWLPAVGFTLAGVFLTPYVIDPMFNQFEPLAKDNAALVGRLEQVVARGGLSIPPERMFLMKASAKSTQLNAYVTGFGASKRVVVWDTTIAHSTPDEISFIFAHEMGHYALGHVILGVAMSCVGLLPLFWLGYHGTRLLLARYGAAWGIRSQHDWGALVILLLVLLAVSAITDPVSNWISRAIEHNADVYGQEAIHGIVADPQTVGRQSFQVLGEDSLDDPTPHPVFEWWFDTHPTTRFRAAFTEAYDPWAAGEHPKYFVK